MTTKPTNPNSPWRRQAHCDTRRGHLSHLRYAKRGKALRGRETTEATTRREAVDA